MKALNSPLAHLQGVGDAKAGAFKRLACISVKDLLYHFPHSIIDRRHSPALNSVEDGALITQSMEVDYHIPPGKRRGPYKIECSNETGRLELVYFNLKGNYLAEKFPAGTKVIVSGKIEKVNGIAQMPHPDYMVAANDAYNIPAIEPVYPLTYAMTNKYMALTAKRALSLAQNFPEWIDKAIIDKHGWPSWYEAIKKAHHPTSMDDLIPRSKHMERLAFDELLSQQLSLQLARMAVRKEEKQAAVVDDNLATGLIKKLPFELTEGQKQAFAEITADQKSSYKMMRLLQGDVGCGKTIVAFLAMLNAVSMNRQAVLMVPTEILAKQHFANLKVLGESVGVKVVQLISNMGAKAKRETLAQISAREVDIVIGTHAVFQEQVQFKELGLAIVDEQHRFGVNQRIALVNKGKNIDLLLMSATPIPRTLSMVQYGDLDVSIIAEKPKNRKAIASSIVSENKMHELYEGIQRVIEKGENVYWVCPLIEESETLSLTNVLHRFDELSKIFPNQVGLVHGKMKVKERDKSMQEFAEGKYKILVATTVIEVGVDVKNATVIVIENAERFGLSQLHQLRGRVGRGDIQSYCVLLHKQGVGQAAYARLKVIRDSDDGFKIAEEDLKIRGSGDVLGTRQSGLPHFRAFNLEVHAYLIAEAHQYIKYILAKDPSLENSAIKLLLELFNYEQQQEYAQKG